MKYLFSLVFLGLLIGCSSGADSNNENIALVERYIQSVENLDYDAMDAILADDYLGMGPSVSDSIGKVAAVANWKNNVQNLYKEIKYIKSQTANVTIQDGPNKGEWVANWAELTIEYQNEKGKVTILANTNYFVKDGKILKSITFYNEADALEQLGYVFINPNDL